MIHPDAQQVFDLSDTFNQLAHHLGNYIDLNKGNLSEEKRNCLYDAQIDLSRFAGSINMIGVDLVFEDLHDTMIQLTNITAKVEKSVEKALAVQKAIDIATSLVAIGNAILAKDPKSIVASAVHAGKVLDFKR